MYKAFLVNSFALACTFFTSQSLAHAEHDKARYVASSGIDNGRCDQVKTPCKTILYAIQHANKGDQVRLAAGSYNIDNADTLFYLLSDLIPILPNYSTQDSFANQSTDNVTSLSPIPLEFATQLADKGFKVIIDSKATEQSQQTTEKILAFKQLQQTQSNLTCENGLSGNYPCNNMGLLAHIPLSEFSTNPVRANDIWGHFDLNTKQEYAIIGLSNGIGFVDVTDPTNPKVITTIASEPTRWRDIKVYQYFDKHLKIWQSYAYVTADSAMVGLLILDLNQLPNTVTVATQDKTDLSAHNVYLSNVDYSTGVALTNQKPYLHIAGSNRNGGGFNTYSLEQADSLVSIYQPVNDRSQYSHDLSSMTITDERKDTQCVNGNSHCEVMFDFNENNFQLWDKTQNNSPEKLSTTSYQNAAYVHSGWYTEDKLLMLVHDELDEQDYGLNTTLRLFDVTDLTAPSLLSTWTGPTKAIDHNGYVRGNRYYMSNYERGITVLDISDTSQPKEVGFFDTYPISNNSAFNGAWGVYPFLPSGNIIASDINSGLYIIQDNTLNAIQGNINFSASTYSVNEGESIDIVIKRNSQANSNAKVNWELVAGSASTTDFVLAAGELSWADNDAADKAIQVTTIADDLAEPNETLFIRLFNPQGGVTLSSPSLATIVIEASQGIVEPTVSAGSNQTVRPNQMVNLTGESNSNDIDNLTYQWQQVSGPEVTINNANSLNASFTAPTTAKTLVFSFTATSPAGLAATDLVSITIEFEKILVVPNKKDAGTIYYALLLLLLLICERKANNCSQNTRTNKN